MSGVEELRATAHGLLERERELEVLADALRAVARDGGGRLVLLSGEAGIG